MPSLRVRTLLAGFGSLVLFGGMTATPPAASAAPASAAPASVFGFRCFRAAGNYVIGLGPMAQPSGNVAMNPSTVPPLKGSGSAPVARIATAIGNYAVDRRCSTIATRLTNLALATGTATPAGIFNLTNFLVPGQIGDQEVIAIERLTLGDVVATVGNGMTAQQAIDVLGKRIRRVAARQAIADSLQDGDIVIFEFVEIRR